MDTSENLVKRSELVRTEWTSQSMMAKMRAMKIYPSAETLGFFTRYYTADKLKIPRP